MRILAIALLALLVACTPETQGEASPKDSNVAVDLAQNQEVESNSKFIVDQLDANTVTHGLSISRKETGESDNGRVRVRWAIKDNDQLEIVGDDQSDADLIAWHCGSYGAADNYLSPVPLDSFCGTFFKSLLTNIVSSPSEVASKLLTHADSIKGTAIWSSGDFSVETDGQFFFVRRQSRQ